MLTGPPYLRGRARLQARRRRRRLEGALLGLGTFLLGALAVLSREGLVTRVKVEGTSMLPALSPGDRLLALRWPVLEAGDIVVVRDPEEPGRLLAKRVARLHAETVEVLGDNERASRDSRRFGPLPRGAVVGTVVYRYHPPSAAGRVR